MAVKRNNKGQFVQGSQYWLGKKNPRTKEQNKKISLALKGRMPTNYYTCVYRYWLGRDRTGLHSIETRRLLSNMNKGEKSHLWRGGVSIINRKARETLDYKLWRESVFKRDNFTCVWCGKWGGRLNADHIKPYSLYPEIRLDVDNGRTLCEDCHKMTESYLNRWCEK